MGGNYFETFEVGRFVGEVVGPRDSETPPVETYADDFFLGAPMTREPT